MIDVRACSVRKDSHVGTVVCGDAFLRLRGREWDDWCVDVCVWLSVCWRCCWCVDGLQRPFARCGYDVTRVRRGHSTAAKGPFFKFVFEFTHVAIGCDMEEALSSGPPHFDDPSLPEFDVWLGALFRLQHETAAMRFVEESGPVWSPESGSPSDGWGRMMCKMEWLFLLAVFEHKEANAASRIRVGPRRPVTVSDWSKCPRRRQRENRFGALGHWGGCDLRCIVPRVLAAGDRGSDHPRKRNVGLVWGPESGSPRDG